MEEVNEAFSEIVYKVPGKNAGPEGKTYDWKGVKSKAELNQTIKDGWHNTLEEAVNIPEPVRARDKEGQYVGDDPSTPDVNEAYVANAPPTRKEITEKAKELGIEFKKNISSEKLLALIEEKLEAGKE